MTSSPVTFYYANGAQVKLGDRVLFPYSSGPREHVVTSIMAPGSPEAEAFGCPDSGGILISLDNGRDTGGVLFTPPDGEHWSDLELVARMQ